jgi:hypothetical protein
MECMPAMAALTQRIQPVRHGTAYKQLAHDASCPAQWEETASRVMCENLKRLLAGEAYHRGTRLQVQARDATDG